MKVFKWSFIKKTFLFILFALLLFIGFLLVNTFRFKSKQISSVPVPTLEINPAAVDHLSQSLRFQTVSPEDPKDFDSSQFLGFTQFLNATYPLVDSLLEKKVFNDFSTLYRWQGSDQSLKPIVFLAHFDVVPVFPENLPDWKHSPFGGDLTRDTIWGRGAIDDKNAVIGVMEALELLLREGFKPKRSIYTAIVHDEEISGFKGAKAIAEWLKAEKIELEYILDEGGYITKDIIPDIEPYVGLIGIAEKGFLSLKMTIKLEGGHSSIPNRETAIDVMAKAISTLKENPFPASISPPIEGFIEYLGPELPFFKKMIFANSSIFSSLIIGVYEEKPSGNALVRTTVAPTIIHGGIKENMIPQFVNATVNLRLLPGETIKGVTARVKQIINDKRIEIEASPFQSEPSKITDLGGWGFQTLHKTISEVYPEALVSPYLMVGATDSRHFSDLTQNILRFSPIKITPANIQSIHGLNERLAVSEFKRSIRFYVRLIKNSAL